MRLSDQLRKLEGEVRRCDGRSLRLAPDGYVPAEADRCRRCGKEFGVKAPREA